LCTNNLQKFVKFFLWNKKFTFTICVGRVLIVIGYFLFEKHAFNGLLKVTNFEKKFLAINLLCAYVSIVTEYFIIEQD
jgi:FtsH-binding integral membrane protein